MWFNIILAIACLVFTYIDTIQPTAWHTLFAFGNGVVFIWCVQDAWKAYKKL